MGIQGKYFKDFPLFLFLYLYFLSIFKTSVNNLDILDFLVLPSFFSFALDVKLVLLLFIDD